MKFQPTTATSKDLDALLDYYFEIVDHMESAVGAGDNSYFNESELLDELEEAERVHGAITRALADSTTPSLALAMSDSEEQNFPHKTRAFAVIPPEVRVRIGLAEALLAQRAAEFLKEDEQNDAQATTVRHPEDFERSPVAVPVRRRTARGTSELDLPAIETPAAPTVIVAKGSAATVAATPTQQPDDVPAHPEVVAKKRLLAPIAGAFAGAALFLLAMTLPELAVIGGGLCLLVVLAYQHRAS